MEKLSFALKCLVIAAIPFCFSFLFRTDINSYTRIQLDEMYNDGEIDALLVGASHIYRSFDVNAIEAATGQNFFGAGTSSQQMMGAYYLIKEAHECNGVKTVYLDVNYGTQAFSKPGKTETYIIADYLRTTKNKCEMVFNAFGTEGLFNILVPSLHGYSVDLNVAKEHLSGKYKNDDYSYVTYDNEAYKGQGYVESYETVAPEYVFDEQKYIDPNYLFSNYALAYFSKIIRYCKDNNIELIFVDPPAPDGTLVATENFQIYVDFIEEIAEKQGIKFLEFNFAKKELLTMSREDYKDAVHLNGVGAEKFTEAFIRVLQEGSEGFFFDTFEEKLAGNPDNTAVY